MMNFKTFIAGRDVNKVAESDISIFEAQLASIEVELDQAEGYPRKSFLNIRRL